MDVGWHGFPKSSGVKRIAVPRQGVRASHGASWRRTGGEMVEGATPLFLPLVRHRAGGGGARQNPPPPLPFSGGRSLHSDPCGKALRRPGSVSSDPFPVNLPQTPPGQQDAHSPAYSESSLDGESPSWGSTSRSGSAEAGPARGACPRAPAPPLEQVRSLINRPDLVTDLVCQRSLRHVARMIRLPPSRSRQLEGNPCGTAATPGSRNKLVKCGPRRSLRLA